MNLVLRRSAGKAGEVCLFMCMIAFNAIYAQQEDSLYFDQPLTPEV